MREIVDLLKYSGIFVLILGGVHLLFGNDSVPSEVLVLTGGINILLSVFIFYIFVYRKQDKGVIKE